MSLLDDVSIVVTPNGYKAGELYSVVPVPIEGAEMLSQPVDLVTDFLVNSGGVIVDADTFTTAGGTFDGIRINSFFTIGKRYKLIIDGDTTSSGFTIGETTLSGNEYGSGFGTHYFTPIGTGSIWLRQQTAGTTNITSFSIKEYTAADMDVTRATAATRVDEDGLVNYAEIIGSEEVTNGDFSGGSTGWTVEDSDADNYVVFDGSTARLKFLNTSPVTTFKTIDAILTGGKSYKLVVDIAVATSGGVKIDGGGISETFNTIGVNTRIITPTVNTSVQFYRASSNVDLTFNSVSVKEVTRDNVPRIDYTGGGCPHILAEPMRTNLVVGSEDFEDATYGEYLVSYTPNFATSPSGESNATKLTSSEVYGNINLNFTKETSAITYTQSIFIKPNNYTLVNFISYGASSSNRSQVTFDLSNGTISSAASSTGAFSNASATITSYTNDYYKISLTYTTDSSAQVRPTMSFPVEMDSTNYVIIWGMQLEVGSYATSYIPNFGTSAGVTRNQDIFTRGGIGSLINSEEGVLFVEMAALANDLTYRTISLNNGTNDECVRIRFKNSSNSVNGLIRNGGSARANISHQVSDIKQFHKLAFKYKSGDSQLWVDGVKVGTSTDTFALSTQTQLNFNQGTSSDIFYGKVRQLQVYNTALTDEQLTSLTS